MPNELVGVIEATPEIMVELAGSGPAGPQGPPGDAPYIGENGNWWVGELDTGVPASGSSGATDHAKLTGRDKADQHPIVAVTGLDDALKTIPPVAEALTNEELEALLK